MVRKALKGFSLIIFAIFFVASTGNSTFAEDVSCVVSSPTFNKQGRVWTDEEMRSAKPYPLPVLPGKPAAPSEVIKPEKPPCLMPSGRPANDRTTPVVEQNEEETGFLDEIDPLGYTYPFLFTTRLEVSQFIQSVTRITILIRPSVKYFC